ncbi:MAG: pyridoxine 5'-phosphate synthase [Candidatus Omnitrophica bacterium]|nr:pyridoxine 5'-phosphate synthase [Candidatus Omnitrophota bacterium]MBU1128514.1 pyridoxine 5'-phosphate synthase [Candidatus Omnitrophota bacterium]MBU1656700.1 pyridoxine 5'-phosphate synthase [Candidatus Omnitrophota bacterium]MBU1784458.1 pyridoxine 5'-phosphate synthase [Candidatus Omnitrophota bacterium]MBU1851357.1 pyridoxine 5'-phosphate synthase [Candidatus Omnitrophota bacterium]
MITLGVNIDHVATVREARKTFEPDPVCAARQCEEAGADGIVCHLRKDRRHINEKDLCGLKEKVLTKLNMEMSVDPEIVDIACRMKPDQATLVPENRQEITTEGGLDCVANFRRVSEVVAALFAAGVDVSLFIDPRREQVEASKKSGAGIIEFHTGRYAEAFNSGGDHEKELGVLKEMTAFAIARGLIVCAGHGLNYRNVTQVARINGMHELNIGHSIISRAVFAGIKEAVKEMKGLIK